MLNSIESLQDPYFDFNKHQYKKLSIKESMGDIFEAKVKEKEESIHNSNKAKEDSKETKITSKIITHADGTKVLQLIKNGTIVTQIKLGQEAGELQEESSGLSQEMIEDREISSTDTI